MFEDKGSLLPSADQSERPQEADALFEEIVMGKEAHEKTAADQFAEILMSMEQK